GQELLERFGGIVGDRGDVAAVEIEDGQRFQHIADLDLLERQRQGGVAVHAGGALEVADAVLVEDDASDGQGGHEDLRIRCRCRLRLGTLLSRERQRRGSLVLQSVYYRHRCPGDTLMAQTFTCPQG